MKRYFTAIAAGILFAAFMALQEERQGTSEWLNSLIQNTPASVIYAVLAFIAIIALGPLVFSALTSKRWLESVGKKSKAQAREIASSLWRVEGDPTVGEKGVRIVFTHMSWPRSFILLVRTEHPDIEPFSRLKDGAIVGFQSFDVTMGRFALDHPLCGYLRIKSIADS